MWYFITFASLAMNLQNVQRCRKTPSKRPSSGAPYCGTLHFPGGPRECPHLYPTDRGPWRGRGLPETGGFEIQWHTSLFLKEKKNTKCFNYFFVTKAASWIYIGSKDCVQDHSSQVGLRNWTVSQPLRRYS